MIEAMKRAYADRARYLGDPAFVNAPISALIAKDYAAKQRAGIDLDHATPWTDTLSTTTPREGSNTTHFSVVDSQGNAVSSTYTLNFSYGVGLVAEGTGVLLNNELDDFTAAPGASNAFGLVGFEANLPGPGKRPLSSMTPTHRAERQQAGAGDGLARRQSHYLHCDAGDRSMCSTTTWMSPPRWQPRACTINGYPMKCGSSTVSRTTSSPRSEPRDIS